MDLVQVYEEVKTRIKKLDFETLWPEFHSLEFALYDREKVALDGEVIDWSPEFVANTSIEYKGRRLAIWNMDQEYDYDRLTSLIVHEMFHSFQHEKDEKRWAKEFDAIVNYQYNKRLLQLKKNENQLLVQLLEHFEWDKWKELLEIRRIRKEEYPYETQYEECIEAIEGSAQYVEFQVLKMLKPALYEENRNRLIKQLLDINNYIPTRMIQYACGAFMLEVCIENGLPVDLTLGNHDKIFYHQVLEEGMPYQKREIPIQPEVERYYDAIYQGYQKQIDEACANGKNLITKPVRLTGLNVYNAWYYKGYVHTTFFLMYEDKEVTQLHGNYLCRLENGMLLEVYES